MFHNKMWLCFREYRCTYPLTILMWSCGGNVVLQLPLKADLGLTGLVQRSAAAGCYSVLIRWTGWPLAVAVSWWQHNNHCHWLLLLLLLLCNAWAIIYTVLLFMTSHVNNQSQSHSFVIIIFLAITIGTCLCTIFWLPSVFPMDGIGVCSIFHTSSGFTFFTHYY